ncbi:MAG: GYD domain-containing protein [Candidatus Rokubacteria bacterium]|nr:GYD domain-containing protein [Candidatus Rokubacteria bacterium]
MAKYLLQASYTTDGLKGVLKDGGSKRRAAAEETVKGLGGKVEAFYFAFGDADAFVIVDVPDNVSATAASLAVNASGAVRVKTTVLITPEEMDQATKKTVTYRPPGHK